MKRNGIVVNALNLKAQKWADRVIGENGGAPFHQSCMGELSPAQANAYGKAVREMRKSRRFSPSCLIQTRGWARNFF